MPVQHFQASRTLKRIMGEGFQFDRMASELNPKPVNVIPLDQFAGVVNEFAFRGDEAAQRMVRAMASLPWHQLFCDAFGVQFEADDRQAFLKTRMATKVTRSAFEDAIARWIDANPDASENAKAFAYINATQRMYVGMWGKCRKSVAESMGLATGDDIRSQMTLDQLSAVQMVENLAAGLMDRAGMDPITAVDEAIARSLSIDLFADGEG